MLWIRPGGYIILVLKSVVQQILEIRYMIFFSILEKFT